MNTHRIDAGAVFGITALAGIAADVVARLLFRSDLFFIAFLRTDGLRTAVSICTGAGLLLAGIALGYVSHEAFNRAVEKSGKVKQLLQEGAYKRVRHPFYLSLLCIVLALALLFASYAILVGWILLTVLLFREAKREEAKLTEQFGETYRRYQYRTGMFLPCLFGRS
jgi:protein-S-isoprenylcysteine O-methyltransferase Ste14